MVLYRGISVYMVMYRWCMVMYRWCMVLYRGIWGYMVLYRGISVYMVMYRVYGDV